MYLLYIDSLCLLQLIPCMQSIGITIKCGGNCGLLSNFQNYQCVDLVNELGIQCNQIQCSPRVYNLSMCISTETGAINDVIMKVTK